MHCFISRIACVRTYVCVCAYMRVCMKEKDNEGVGRVGCFMRVNIDKRGVIVIFLSLNVYFGTVVFTQRLVTSVLRLSFP